MCTQSIKRLGLTQSGQNKSWTLWNMLRYKLVTFTIFSARPHSRVKFKLLFNFMGSSNFGELFSLCLQMLSILTASTNPNYLTICKMVCKWSKSNPGMQFCSCYSLSVIIFLVMHAFDKTHILLDKFVIKPRGLTRFKLICRAIQKILGQQLRLKPKW